MNNTFVIIDGNSLINRAFYAMQKPMITKEGIYTQGIFGFLNMLSKIKKEYEPEYIAVTFDVHAPTFRHLEYKEYKAGRKHMPPELLMEMPILKDILHAMNITTFELAGYEADDLIGTLSRAAEENDISPLIVSGDRDQLQLASDKTKVLFTKRGVTDFDLFDETHFFEVYGFKPLQFIDYKAIYGDKSDNIPGIPGIGEKGATELLLKFGSIENLIEKADEIEKQSLRSKVKENVELAILSKKLATINRFAPIDINFDELKVKSPDYDKLIDLYKKLEFSSFLRKLEIPEKSTSESPAVSKVEYAFKGNKRVLDYISILDSLKNKDVYLKIFSDFSHINNPTIYGLFLSSKDDAIYVSDVNKNVIDKLNNLNLRIYGHNLKEDLYPLMFYGYKEFDVLFDTEIASYILNSSLLKYDLNEIAIDKLHRSVPKESDFLGDTQMDMFSNNDLKYLDYGVLLSEIIYNLYLILDGEVKSQNLDKLLNEIELPLIKVLTSMEVCGIKIESSYLESFSKDLILRLNELENEIYEIAEEKFNIKSTQQLGTILFDKLKLPPSKKTKTGYSTAQEVLEQLKDQSPIIQKILEYRNLSKLQSTYVDGMKPLITSDGRIRAHFNQTITQTGRLSCSDPNLQNIPVRQELGRKLRNAFLADDDCVLIGADYSQIELRVLASLSKDEALVTAFNNGEDIHKLTASRVLGIPIENVTSLDRSRAKAVNFGVIYGMSSFGLSEELKISRSDATEYINEYFRKHPKVKEYMDSQIQFAKDNGYTLTLFNRKRYIPEINASNFMVRSLGERYAMNSPIQGTAADIIKIAMIKVYKELKEKYPDSKLILQVHDELIINAKKIDEKAINELLRRNMEEAVKMDVKLEVQINQATNWYDLK